MVKPVEIKLYIEAHCPYCNYVQKFILLDIIARRDDINKKLIREGMHPIPPIELRVIDVEATYDEWFEWYSDKIGSRATPTIVIGNKIFYLFGRDKPQTLQQRQISRTSLLKSQIIQELQDIQVRIDKMPDMIKPERPILFEINTMKRKTYIPAYYGGINE